MMLPLLILWWAKCPMRFAYGRYRRVIVAGLVFAAFTMAISGTQSLLMAADPKTFFGQDADGSMVASPQQRESSLRDDRLESNRLGDAGRGNNDFATNDHDDRYPAKPSSMEDARRDAAVLRREGTRLQNINGRIEKLGRRWMFIADDPLAIESNDGSASDSRSRVTRVRQETRADQFWKQSRDERLRGDAASPLMTSDASQDWKWDGNPTRTASESIAAKPRDAASMLLTENLMLGRIVSAITEDPVDNRWTVTGVLTEFEEENFLTLTWARRADHTAAVE